MSRGGVRILDGGLVSYGLLNEVRWGRRHSLRMDIRNREWREANMAQGRKSIRKGRNSEENENRKTSLVAAGAEIQINAKPLQSGPGSRRLSLDNADTRV